MPEIDKSYLSKLPTSELEMLQEQVEEVLNQRDTEYERAEEERRVCDAQTPLLQREDTDLSPKSLEKKQILLHLQTLLQNHEDGLFRIKSLDNPLIKHFYDYVSFVFEQVKAPGIYIDRHELTGSGFLTIQDHAYQWQGGERKMGDRFSLLFSVGPKNPLTAKLQSISALLLMHIGEKHMRTGFCIPSQALRYSYLGAGIEFDFFKQHPLEPGVAHLELNKRMQIL